MFRFLLVLLISLPSWVFSQSTIKGKLVDENGAAVKGALITIFNTELSTTSADDGSFELQNVPTGNQRIFVASEGHDLLKLASEITAGENQLSTITVLTENIRASETDLPTTSEGGSEDRDTDNGQVASALNAARDVFASAATFTFNAARFRLRGYDDDNNLTLMNGAPMTDLANGRNTYNLWGGLNDVMRSRETSYGLQPVNYNFGTLGSTVAIDSRASRQRKQLQVSYALSNRSYDNRLMLTYGTGLLKNGWSFAGSLSRRWADEAFVQGTFFDGYSGFIAAEKIINTKHAVALTGFASPSRAGRSAPAIQEVYDLAGSNYYNANWGYQNGVKRNASVRRNNQPIFILTHDWKIDDRANVLTSIHYSKGTVRQSGLDWLNAPDPRPDYYRNLPSFDPFFGENPAQFAIDRETRRQYFLNNPNQLQIQWDDLYAANYLSGDTARYILQDRVTDNRRAGFNTIYNRIINDHLTIASGLNYLNQRTENYTEVNDLLGAQFYPDINRFAQLQNNISSSQLANDLNNPGRVVKVGDRYGYDYIANISEVNAWMQGVWKFNRFDYFAAGQLTSNGFYREGKMKNGIFPTRSFGKSEVQRFFNYNIKGGTTFKYNGRNYLYANIALGTRAPYFEDVFVSPRSRNDVIANPRNVNFRSVEAGYLYRAPKMKAKVTGYLTQFKNETETKTFYHEDFRTFLNYSISKIAKRHVGLELALERNIGKGLSANAVAAIGQYYYSDRPEATITYDNQDTLVANKETVFFKNLRLGNGAQTAFTIGLNYRSKKFWFLNLNVNFFDNIYIDPNPSRRTATALELLDDGSPVREAILKQTRIDGQMTVDLFGGWSWRMNNKFKSLKRPTFIVLNLGVNNILNNTSFITGGFEQLRFDFSDRNVNKFPPRLNYGLGTNYFISVTYRMN